MISTISYILLGLLHLVYMEAAFDKDQILACASFFRNQLSTPRFNCILRLHMVDNAARAATMTLNEASVL